MQYALLITVDFVLFLINLQFDNRTTRVLPMFTLCRRNIKTHLFLTVRPTVWSVKKTDFDQRRSWNRRHVNSAFRKRWSCGFFFCPSFSTNPKWPVNVAFSNFSGVVWTRLWIISIFTVHRVSTMDGPKLSVTTRLNVTCTNCARTPWKENAFSFLLRRIWRRSWLVKWRGVNRLVQTCTTELFVRLANFTGRKILQPGANPPAPSNVETLQSCWTFSLTHITIFHTTKKCH